MLTSLLLVAQLFTSQVSVSGPGGATFNPGASPLFSGTVTAGQVQALGFGFSSLNHNGISQGLSFSGSTTQITSYGVGSLVNIGDGTNQFLQCDYTGCVIAKTMQSIISSGSNAFAVSTNGARFDIGTGANDYWYGDGTGILTPGALTVAGTLTATSTLIVDGFGAVLRNGNASPFTIQGSDGDDAVAEAIILKSGTALTTAGGVIASFSNNGTRKAAIDKDGGVKLTGVATGSLLACAAGTEGLVQYDTTVHKLMVCDGTTWQAAW